MHIQAKDLLFFQADIHGNLLIRQRMKVIRALLEEEELTVVTSIDGCMDFLETLEKIKSQLIHYESDSTVDMDALKENLVKLGYERVGQVEMPGQFSIRGGIVDIYCLTEENPWRIELWGDEIDSIRSFDAESQRSLEKSGGSYDLSGGGTYGRTGYGILSGLFSERKIRDLSG